jgi:hypothetical protein
MITEADRAATVQRLADYQAKLPTELALVALLDLHEIVQVDNLGYYRSQVHCRCAAEWWAGAHVGDPDYSDMWAIHRAEVIAAFYASRTSADAAEEVSGG